MRGREEIDRRTGLNRIIKDARFYAQPRMRPTLGQSTPMPDRAKNTSHPRLISDPVPPVLLSNSALPGETDRHFVRGVEGYRNHPWRQRLEHTPPRLRALGVVTGRGGSRVRGEKRFTGDCTHRFCGRAHFPSCSKPIPNLKIV